MPPNTNRPSQLEKIRKEHYDKLYGRNPQLMERLIPFLVKAQIIEEFTEPKIAGTEPNGKRRRLIKELNKFRHSKKPTKLKKPKKISEVRPDVLWGLR